MKFFDGLSSCELKRQTYCVPVTCRGSAERVQSRVASSFIFYLACCPNELFQLTADGTPTGLQALSESSRRIHGTYWLLIIAMSRQCCATISASTSTTSERWRSSLAELAPFNQARGAQYPTEPGPRPSSLPMPASWRHHSGIMGGIRPPLQQPHRPAAPLRPACLSRRSGACCRGPLRSTWR